jgi:CRISPR/Cas system-associated exonuclease Cas4 (RecB family)
MGLLECVTPTRLNTWLLCPLKFQIRYVRGIKEPTSPSRFLGQRVHDSLAFFYCNRQAGRNVSEAEVAQHLLDSWNEAVIAEEMSFDSDEDMRALSGQAVRLVHTYLAQLDPSEGQPFAVESPLECPLVDPKTGEYLGVALFGVVDLALDTRTGPVLVDFKTSARAGAPLPIAHEVQLSCYAYAFRQVFGEIERRVEIRSLIKTKTPKVETHKYPARDDIHFRRLFAVIRAYLTDLHSDRFVYRPGWTCSMCEFRDTHCRTWQG